MKRVGTHQNTKQWGFVQQAVFEKCPLENSPMQGKGLSDVSRKMVLVLFFFPILCVCECSHVTEAKDIFICCSPYLGFVLPRQVLWLKLKPSSWLLWQASPDCLPMLVLQVLSQCLAFYMRARETTQISMLVHHLLLNCLHSLLYFLFYTNHHSGFFSYLE